MTDKPHSEDDKLPDAEAEERFNRTVGNLLNTPADPHRAKKPRNESDGNNDQRRG
jgi:hypothetical protein